MSERKVITKYYPPEFDPSKIARTRGSKDKSSVKLATVRLMAPFSMKCTSCGEYIYKGRKFNARKEITDEKYFSISIIRFYIRCTRCSGEITFKTDPKNMDYACEKGAKRNFEIWRQNPEEGNGNDLETEEERLERLEAEEAERGVMENLESKQADAKREMEIADALDEIRTRNARNERASKKEEADIAKAIEDERVKERRRQEAEDDEMARRAFSKKALELEESIIVDDVMGKAMAREVPNEFFAVETAEPEIPLASGSFKRAPKKKKDHAAALGIKKKALVV